ncbi:hypothetical protein TrVE_jg3146 [Triparma verrucosa]|uniref:Uncharacterized protein n=2 Tax=Triparma TaxID=722752 RepID=A0A9W7BTB3_9STRA|nr:hypothetical protein TrVE_jg3146 [Triparma verrucosa]GMH96111.1 hypothetical protein TrST_g4636 [Triparma strigata]
MSYDPSKPSLVPELVLKKKANLDRLSAARADRLKANGNRKVFSRNGNVVKIRKPETYVAKHKGKINGGRRFERVKKKGLQAKKKRAGAVVEKVLNKKTGIELDSDDESAPEADKEIVQLKSNSLTFPSVFVVRIRAGDSSTPSSVKKSLSDLRLRNANEGCFVRVTDATRRILECCEPYIVYGALGEDVVKELLSRRGYAKVSVSSDEGDSKPERIPLDNVVIEENIGDSTGCICVEDVIAEIMNPGENFRAVNNFLWPFKLSDVDGGFTKRKLKIISNKVGDYGDKGEAMGDVLKKMM